MEAWKSVVNVNFSGQFSNEIAPTKIFLTEKTPRRNCSFIISASNVTYYVAMHLCPACF